MNGKTCVLVAVAFAATVSVAAHDPAAREVGLTGMFPPDVKTVGIVSVSSLIPKDKFVLGTNLLVRAGYRVKVMPNVLKSVSPARRARYFEDAWLDPEIDFLLFSRGGKGASNVVTRIDWKKLESRKMRVMGFSDVTLILNAMEMRKVGRPIAGPMLSTLSTYCTVESCKWLRQVLDGTPAPLKLQPVKPCPAPVHGRPVGGLLSRLPVLRDRKLLPSFAGRVAIIECTTKYADSAEGDLDALVAGGVFDGAAAVVFADFNSNWAEKKRAALFARFAAKVKCPVFSGYPFGHIPRSFAFDFTRALTIAPDGMLTWDAAESK